MHSMGSRYITFPEKPFECRRLNGSMVLFQQRTLPSLPTLQDPLASLADPFARDRCLLGQRMIAQTRADTGNELSFQRAKGKKAWLFLPVIFAILERFVAMCPTSLTLKVH